MNAIHTNRTAIRGGEEDFELLTAAISALKWREHNGSIKMITDKNGAEFYRRNGLEFLWDGGVFDELSDIPADPKMFWAAGKIYALRIQKAPIAVLDMDFIVWEKLDFDKITDAAVIHFEDINGETYPEPSVFRMNSGYEFPSTDKNLKACNTAFYIIKNQSFLELYTAEAIRFIENAKRTDEPLTYMLYAEQRLFNICAERLGIKTEAFSDLNSLYTANSRFTHTWGMKQQMRDNADLREKFCRRCAKRIETDFPDAAAVLKKTEIVGRYFSTN